MVTKSPKTPSFGLNVWHLEVKMLHKASSFSHFVQGFLFWFWLKLVFPLEKVTKNFAKHLFPQSPANLPLLLRSLRGTLLAQATKSLGCLVWSVWFAVFGFGCLSWGVWFEVFGLGCLVWGWSLGWGLGLVWVWFWVWFSVWFLVFCATTSPPDWEQLTDHATS